MKLNEFKLRFDFGAATEDVMIKVVHLNFNELQTGSQVSMIFYTWTHRLRFFVWFIKSRFIIVRKRRRFVPGLKEGGQNPNCSKNVNGQVGSVSLT